MRRPREQVGYIYKRNGWWILRYRQTVNVGGELKTTQPAVQLAPVDANHKTKRNVEELAKDKLADINKRNQKPETVTTMGEFVERIYLPFVESQKRPSTLKGYSEMWERHLKPRCENVLLPDVRTCHVQRWLDSIAADDKTKAGTGLRRETLKHIKSMVSGIFSHAKQQGYFDGENPVRNTAVPKGLEGGDTHAYSVEEITRMLMLVPEPAGTIVATAAFTGLRRGELQGMVWENLADGTYSVDRSIWEGQVTEPKTKASRARIPIIKSLASMLEKHRVRMGSPTQGPIFRASNRQPIRLNNVLIRDIKPALNRCVCGKTKADHKADADHDFKRDMSLPVWRGWHAFRRGLATNLNRMGVQDKTIQAVMRHSNLNTTMNVYVKAVDADAVSAMKALDALMCAERAPGAAVFPSARVN